MDCRKPTTAVATAITMRNAHFRTMNSLGMWICFPMAVGVITDVDSCVELAQWEGGAACSKLVFLPTAHLLLVLLCCCASWPPLSFLESYRRQHEMVDCRGVAKQTLLSNEN